MRPPGHAFSFLPSPTPPQDFEAALREISASVDPDSATVQELEAWQKQYGTTANRAGVRGTRLSYFT